jgi:DNA-binding response OmpR family regulator
MSKRILVIEDDKEISKIIVSYLEKESYSVVAAYDGKKGFDVFQQEQNFDLILLDIMLPGMDGWSVCRKIRQQSNIPIIMLTARDDEDDEVYGFELKANDYIKKPFSPKVLIARIKSMLEGSENVEVKDETEMLRRGLLEMNPTTREILLDGEIVNLTNKEFNILHLLASNEKIVFSREIILNKIWEYDYIAETRIVDNHIKNIRKALGDYSYYISTVFGVGYKFEVK